MEEKRFDPYQFIGFVLIALILTWMLYVNRPEEKVISDAQPTNTEAATVPDPFDGGLKSFDLALNYIEDACEGLVETICRKAAINAAA